MRLTFVVVPLAIVGVDDLREDNALAVGDLDLVFLISSSFGSSPFPISLIGLIMSESSLASTLSCNTPEAVDPVAMAPS